MPLYSALDDGKEALKMKLTDLMKQKNLSIYRLSKLSSVPYSTLNDVCNEKTELKKCSAETIYRISRVLNVSMEELLDFNDFRPHDFENFKSNVCQKVKELRDLPFILKTLENNTIRDLYKKEYYAEALYLLAMIDYLSRLNNIPLCADYNDLRSCKLKEVVYPVSIRLKAAIENDDSVLQEAVKNSIPEFIRHNIVENEVRNVA